MAEHLLAEVHRAELDVGRLDGHGHEVIEPGAQARQEVGTGHLLARDAERSRYLLHRADVPAGPWMAELVHDLLGGQGLEVRLGANEVQVLRQGPDHRAVHLEGKRVPVADERRDHLAGEDPALQVLEQRMAEDERPVALRHAGPRLLDPLSARLRRRPDLYGHVAASSRYSSRNLSSGASLTEKRMASSEAVAFAC